MIESFAAYAQLVLGLPIIIASLLWYGPNRIIENIWEIENISTYYYMGKNVIEGLVSLLFAYGVFECLHVKITIWIPLILMATSSIWKASQNEGFMIFFINIGIMAGYKLFPLIRSSLAQW